MVLAASRKNGVRFFKVATLQRQAHLQPCNVPFSGSDKVWTGLQGCPFQRTALAPRRAQNLLAGCIFDGLACQKCFCVTLGKSNRTEEERFLRDWRCNLCKERSAQWSEKAQSTTTAANSSGECRRQPHSSQYRLLQRADKESVSRIIR